MPSKATIRRGGSKYRHTRYGKYLARKLNQRQKVQVKSIVSRRMEKKYYDSNWNTGVDWAGTIVDLCQISNGQSDITRNGDEITFVRLDFVCSWTSSLDSFNTVRLVIFQWKPLQTPLVSNIADTNSPNPITTINAPYFQYNWDNRLQYKILYSRILHLDAVHGPVVKHFSGSIYGKRVNKRIRYNSTALVPGYNHIYALLMSDDSASSYPVPFLRTRLVYTDA